MVVYAATPAEKGVFGASGQYTVGQNGQRRESAASVFDTCRARACARASVLVYSYRDMTVDTDICPMMGGSGGDGGGGGGRKGGREHDSLSGTEHRPMQ
jgi:hypothetical protein